MTSIKICLYGQEERSKGRGRRGRSWEENATTKKLKIFQHLSSPVHWVNIQQISQKQKKIYKRISSNLLSEFSSNNKLVVNSRLYVTFPITIKSYCTNTQSPNQWQLLQVCSSLTCNLNFTVPRFGESITKCRILGGLQAL